MQQQTSNEAFALYLDMTCEVYKDTHTYEIIFTPDSEGWVQIYVEEVGEMYYKSLEDAREMYREHKNSGWRTEK
jgi:hypothetical protein